MVLIQYSDDILLFSTDCEDLRWDNNQLVTDLSRARWVISPKTVEVDKAKITLLGILTEVPCLRDSDGGHVGEAGVQG